VLFLHVEAELPAYLLHALLEVLVARHLGCPARVVANVVDLAALLEIILGGHLPTTGLQISGTYGI
jgi:hypothetical protein